MIPLLDSTGLCLVDVTLAGSEGDTQVVFDLLIGKDHIGRLEATPEEIGLPRTTEAARRLDRDPRPFRLPDHVVETVSKQLTTVASSNAPVWVHVGFPCGFLPVLPWEQGFQPGLDRPVLRLANLDVAPARSREAFDVVICFSSPAAKPLSPELIAERLVAELPPDLAHRARFHVFTDRAVHPVALRLRERFGARYDIAVYDPPEAPVSDAVQESDPTPSRGAEISNPWLVWIQQALGGLSVDLVHFVCHGYLGRDRGNIAFAEPPWRNDDADWARCVDGLQLSSFLTQIGAWCVAFSSPPGNASIGGLRLLQDQLSRVRPGAVLVHDMALTRGKPALGDAYRFLFGEGPPPRSPAISLCCHPSQFGDAISSDRNEKLLDEFTLSGRLGTLIRGPVNAPAWIAASQRLLEEAVAGVTAVATSDHDAAIKEGSESALRFVSDVLAKHALGQLKPGSKS